MPIFTANAAEATAATSKAFLTLPPKASNSFPTDCRSLVAAFVPLSEYSETIRAIIAPVATSYSFVC